MGTVVSSTWSVVSVYIRVGNTSCGFIRVTLANTIERFVFFELWHFLYIQEIDGARIKES